MFLLSLRSSGDGWMRSSNPTVRMRRPAGGSVEHGSRSTTGALFQLFQAQVHSRPALFRERGEGGAS
jgi:hypothetical protein